MKILPYIVSKHGQRFIRNLHVVPVCVPVSCRKIAIYTAPDSIALGPDRYSLGDLNPAAIEYDYVAVEADYALIGRCYEWQHDQH
jgi:hypothetical protein